MKAAPIPANDSQRLAALRRSNLLDTPREVTFDRITRLASRLLGTPVSLLSLIDEDRQWFKSKVGLDLEQGSREASFCGHAIDYDGVMVVPDATSDERFADNPWVIQDPSIRFYAGAPLRTADGHALGTLCAIDNKPRQDFSEEDKKTLRDLADIAMAQIELRRSVGYLDAETGVYTRQRMLETLRGEAQASAKDGQQRLVAIVDVAMSRQLRELTQVMGYKQTELFILESINRIAASIGHDSDLYRIGLFRFGFIIREYAGPITRSQLDELAQTLREPFDSKTGIPITPIATIGVADIEPGVDDPAEEALRSASVALDSALNGNRWWAFYDSEYDQQRQRKFQLLSDLPAALNAPDQLHLLYQPKVDLATGACTGVEALLRWNHPKLGPVPPTELIDAAEKTALMRPLTDWVLSQAAAQSAQWREQGLHLKIAVNVSAHDLSDNSFPLRISEQLQAHGVDGQALEIEFTEGALVQNLDAATVQLEHIHELGVSTAIDDFGTGYCNLSYLHNIPAGTIKLDRSFILLLENDPPERRLTKAIIALAQDLGFGTVAEGVETEATRDFLAQWGCEQAQGYLYSKPVGPVELTVWLRRRENAS